MTDERPATERLEGLLKQAAQACDRGDRQAGAKLLDGAPDELKGFASWHYARGKLALDANDCPRALLEFEEAVKREPEVPELKANLGAALLELVRQGDRSKLPRALEILEEAAREFPRLPHAHTNCGMAKLAGGDAVGALACFDRALALDPKHLPSLFDRAAALDSLGRHRDALAALDQLLAIDPKFKPALEARSRVEARGR